jgi:DNA-binding CsgD family transcriptional regulator
VPAVFTGRPAAPLVCPVVVGRTEDRALLELAVGAVGAGDGRTLAIAGEPGIGKSRLAAELKAGARQRGFVCLEGHCFEQDRAIPYAPLLDLLRAHFADRPAEAVAGGLTAREREVAALIARGKSNRDIAEALVLGPRTVQTHVAHILAKLGCSSRAQVAAWAADQGAGVVRLDDRGHRRRRGAVATGRLARRPAPARQRAGAGHRPRLAPRPARLSHAGHRGLAVLLAARRRRAGTELAAAARREERSGMSFGRLQLHPGMAVVQPLGPALGTVTRVDDETFTVAAPGGEEFQLPYTAVRALLGDQVVVDGSAPEVAAHT